MSGPQHRFPPLRSQAEMDSTAEHGRTLRQLALLTAVLFALAALAAHVLPKAVAQARLDAAIPQQETRQ